MSLFRTDEATLKAAILTFVPGLTARPAAFHDLGRHDIPWGKDRIVEVAPTCARSDEPPFDKTPAIQRHWVPDQVQRQVRDGSAEDAVDGKVYVLQRASGTRSAVEERCAHGRICLRCGVASRISRISRWGGPGSVLAATTVAGAAMRQGVGRRWRRDG